MQRIWLSFVMLFPIALGVSAGQAQQETPTSTPTPSATNLPMGSPTAPAKTAEPGISISSPVPGQALQGNVTISGSSVAEGFVSSELAFAYSGDPTDTWFLIVEATQPVASGPLAQWDTSTITDGNYSLRLRVMLQNGNHLEVIVPGLRVRNYTPVETDTPTPVTPTATRLPGETPVPSITPTIAVRPTSTPLPTNPAEVSRNDIAMSAGKGALAIVGLFALMAVYKLVKGIGEKE